jgi:hypothetical protein
MVITMKATPLPLAAIAFAFAVACGAGAQAQSANGCPNGSYSVVLTPDGGTLTVLFDAFVVEAGGTTGSSVGRKTCRLHIPLQLPANTSVGVYKVDYRGYASVPHRQQFELRVVHGFNGDREHAFNRQLRGRHDDEFAFSQTIGAGLMRRVGCGENAALDVEATITLNTNGQPGHALAALDSLDGAPRGGLVYHFNFSRCR